MAKREYSTAAGGPVQRAFRLRIEGRTYPEIRAALRKDFSDCARISVGTIETWARSGRLWWDTIHELESQYRAEQMPSAASPEGVERLSQVRELIDTCSSVLKGQASDELVQRLKKHGVRPDTLLLKLIAEEQKLTRSDLLGVPKGAIQRVVLLVMEKLFRILLEKHLVSQDRLLDAAKDIEREMVSAMPGELRAVAAQETVSDARS